VAASIAFTAALGVAVVIGLPVLGAAFGMHALSYGAFAGMTVYAVPQVIAAAAPFGAKAVQMGTLVKLVRVLMLGPVCLALSVLTPGLRRGAHPVGDAPPDNGARPRLSFGKLVPWFIIGFLLMIASRSLGLIPAPVLGPLAEAATVLTVVSMAALGLGVDVRAIARSGATVTGVAIVSLLALGSLSILLLKSLHFF
jgi:uncharacterized membrane protein YadS